MIDEQFGRPNSNMGQTRYLVLNQKKECRRILIRKIPYLITINNEEKLSIYENYNLLIENGIIIDFDHCDKLCPNLSEIDLIYDASLRGGIAVTPGFINAHAHPPMYLLRGCLTLEGGEELETSLKQMFTMESQMKFDDFMIGALGDFTEEQKNGITSTLSHYGCFEPIEYAARKSGHRVINALSAVSNSHPENSPAMVRKLLKKSMDYFSKPAVALHYPYKANMDQLKEIKALIDDFGVLFTTHAAETLECERRCMEKHGKSSIGTLIKAGLLSKESILSHSIHFTEKEIEACIKAETGIVHLPTSNKLHKSGTFPLETWEAKNGLDQIALGTDSVVSKNNLDILGEALQARILHQEKTTMSHELLFKMMTSNGAKILGLNKVGKIEKGYKADLAFWKLRDRGFIPYDEQNPSSLIENMITYGNRQVRDLMISGTFIISNRKHNLINERDLMKEIQVAHTELQARAKK